MLSPVARETAAPPRSPEGLRHTKREVSTLPTAGRSRVPGPPGTSQKAVPDAASRALCGQIPLRASTWPESGRRGYFAGAAFALAIYARICDSSTGNGTEPCDSTASWKARTSNFGPSAASASVRRRRIASSPSL